MYIALSWQAHSGANKTTVQNDIESTVKNFDFLNVFIPFQGQLFANVKKPKGKGEVRLLSDRLKTLGSNRFSFTLCYLPRGNGIGRSTDVASPKYATIVNY